MYENLALGLDLKLLFMVTGACCYESDQSIYGGSCIALFDGVHVHDVITVCLHWVIPEINHTLPNEWQPGDPGGKAGGGGGGGQEIQVGEGYRLENSFSLVIFDRYIKD